MDNRKYNAEEFAQFFLNQLPQKSFSKNVKMSNNKNFSTLRDSLNVNDSESSISTKSISQEQDLFKNHMKKNSIEINKELIKFAEPRWKAKPAVKVPQKFLHESNKESELSDFDEINLQMKGIQPMKQVQSLNKPFIIDGTFPFYILVDIEKCYQDLLKDFKGNNLENRLYKATIASSYISLVIDKLYVLDQAFTYNKDVNVFLIEEFCMFLLILFIEDYEEDKLEDNQLIDFKTCLSYGHINFLFVIMLIMDNINSISNIIDKTNYENCKTLLELNANKIDSRKYQLNFHSQNKIIKNVLNNLLSNLTDTSNQSIIRFIMNIFNQVKTKTATNIVSLLQINKDIKSKLDYYKNDQLPPSLEHLDNDGDDEDDDNLPIPTVPYLPPKRPSDKRRYTMVLDLDETLVHYFEDENEDNAYVKVRMGTEAFITTLAKYFEIVVFTASTKYYADIVVDGLDSKSLIDYRLYRQHTNPTDGINIKDLSKIGRDLSKTIIIDNIEENYRLQPLNGLNISNFEGDENDCELNYLLEDLLEIEKKKIDDVRDYLPVIRRKMQARYTSTS